MTDTPAPTPPGTGLDDLTLVLDPVHRAAVEAMPRDLLDLTDIAASREALAGRYAAAPLPEGVHVEDVVVPGEPGDPDVVVRVYRPEGLAPGAPAVYWIHGGGLVMGSVAQNDVECALRAARHRCLVASVEYRLAPEDPYPAALHDCHAGLVWLATHADALGIDPSRIAVAGSSAGGGLAAGLALLARERGGPAICFQLLVYPMLDHRNVTPSSHAIVDSRVWNRAANRAAWDAYLGGRADGAVPPFASPSLATDLAGLPPAHVAVGTFDLFLDEDIAYARALLHAGVPAELHVYPGAFHGSLVFVPQAPLSRRWRRDEQAALEAALHPEV